MYAETSTQLEIGGTQLGISQTTKYPNDGRIEVLLDPQKPTSFRLHLRIPTWAGDQFVPGKLYKYLNKSNTTWELSVNGKSFSKPELGFVTIERVEKRVTKYYWNYQCL